MKKFIFSKGVGSETVTSLKVNFFIGIFLRLWRQISEHLFSRTDRNGCVCRIKNYVKHRFLQITTLNRITDLF